MRRTLGGMRRIVYAGESFITSAEVARTLLRLAIGVTALGGTELVEVPIAVNVAGESETAELVLGPGVPLLSLPVHWDGEEPDFSAQAIMLQMRSSYPSSGASEPLYSPHDEAGPWATGFDEW